MRPLTLLALLSVSVGLVTLMALSLRDRQYTAAAILVATAVVMVLWAETLHQF